MYKLQIRNIIAIHQFTKGGIIKITMYKQI